MRIDWRRSLRSQPGLRPKATRWKVSAGAVVATARCRLWAATWGTDGRGEAVEKALVEGKREPGLRLVRGEHRLQCSDPPFKTDDEGEKEELLPISFETRQERLSYS